MAFKAQDDLSFPQRATVQIDHPNPTTEATQRHAGPNFFRDGENVHFMRAEKIQSVHYSQSSQFLDLELQTKLYINRTAQTHDSVMHQFIDGEAEAGTLWMRVYFFTEDIFRVQYASTVAELDDLIQQPEFPFPEARMLVGSRQDIQVNFTETTNSAALSSSRVEVQAQHNPFQLSARFTDRKAPFWKHRVKDLFTSDHIPTSVARHQGRTATFESFLLSPSEGIYGLGERFDGASRRGRPTDFVNHDAIGTSNTRSYINVPFFWSTAGYGCFVNSYARTEWDVGMSEAGAIGFCTEEPHMDYFIIGGKTPKDILRSYTADLTGVPKLPPTWTFGLWFSRNSYTSWDVVDSVVSKCNEHQIPLDVVHLDTFWFKEDWKPDLLFDPIRFPDPETKMAHFLQSSGIHTSLWQYSFIINDPANILYQEATKNNYIATNGPNSAEPFKYPPNTSGWKTDDLVIDFSNPAAREWYKNKIAGLVKQGATAIKTDFGDCNPPDAHYRNVLGRKFQNSYSLAYNATVQAGMRLGAATAAAAAAADADADGAGTGPSGSSKTNGDLKVNGTAGPTKANTAATTKEPSTTLWSRSGTAGSQRYPLHWSGDSQCSFTALQGTLSATLSMGNSGFAFFASDTGGFIGQPSPELYIRWTQLAMFCASHFRLHGAGDNNQREPWAFGDQAVRVFRRCADVRYRLLPYLVAEARRACDAGIGLVRGLVLEWPADRNLWGAPSGGETQCMLGDALMVAPVTRPLEEMETEWDVYFPGPGERWFDFWTGWCVVDNTDTQGRWVTMPTPALEEVPMWVRSGRAVCFAEGGRLRTWDQVGEVKLVKCYGVPEGWKEGDEWIVDDGDGGAVRLGRKEDGSWEAVGREGVVVESYN